MAKTGPNTVELPVKTTSRISFVNITSGIKDAVRVSGIASGICMVFCPHTTAGLTINENADPDVVRDIIMKTSKMVPENEGYKHSEGNSDAHIKSSLFGPSLQLIVENSDLLLGTWQSVYFCEFDGPRSRRVYVKVFEA
jgi:secondary thiamine-phosphate synthase enzyme